MHAYDGRDEHSRRCSIPTIHNFKEFQKQLQADLNMINQEAKRDEPPEPGELVEDEALQPET